MSGKRLMDALEYSDDKYLDLVETQRVRKKPFWRYGTIAAAVLICLFSTFSIGVFAADWFGIRSMIMPKTVDESQEIKDPVTAGQYRAELEKKHDFISLSGYTDSPESQALAEWNTFLATYDPDGSILHENDKKINAWGEDVSQYFVYSEEMADKLREIAAKYDLYLHTTMEIYMADEFAACVGGQFWSNNCAPGCAYIYEDGTFQYDADYIVNDKTISYQFRRSVKGVFNEVELNIDKADDYEEWQFVTKSGEPVLLALGPGKALIYTDSDNCFILANVLSGTVEGMTRKELEGLADSIDFSLLMNVEKMSYASKRENTLPKPTEYEPEFPTSMEEANGWQEAYQVLLINVSENFQWPDHTLVNPVDWSDMSKNDFQVQDVDGDGEKELIVRFVDTNLSEMCCRVFGYDAVNKECFEKLNTTPGVRFYDNGLVEAELLHNMGPVCDSLWPYSMYQYDPEKNAYDFLYSVYGFDKDMAEELGDDSYPEEVDVENYGTVYYMNHFGETCKDAIDRAEYVRQLELLRGDEIQITYLPMTRENIKKITEE